MQAVKVGPRYNGAKAECTSSKVSGRAAVIQSSFYVDPAFGFVRHTLRGDLCAARSKGVQVGAVQQCILGYIC